MKCRNCGSDVSLPLIDLGAAPPSNAYLTKEALHRAEAWYPLRVLVCESCWLVQTEDFVAADDLFNSSYAYFSRYSTSWTEHARRAVERYVERFDLTPRSLVVELASNDGYLLQFVQERAIPCYGVEPTTAAAAAARSLGIETVEAFFGRNVGEQLADERGKADLIVANNVLAHVPDINDFLAGVAELLQPTGVAVFEFQHVLRLIEGAQFDTIYHEHFSYLSLGTLRSMVSGHGLTVFDVESLPTHGGSLRVYVRRSTATGRPTTSAVDAHIQEERCAGLESSEPYRVLQARAEEIKNNFVSFLIDAKRNGLKVAGYGAAAKGNTLLNFAGIREDLLPYVVDRSAMKQGKYLPGSRIPVVDESSFYRDRPDIILILPWNLREEISNQLKYSREWGCKFLVAIPEIQTF